MILILYECVIDPQISRLRKPATNALWEKWPLIFGLPLKILSNKYLGVCYINMLNSDVNTFRYDIIFQISCLRKSASYTFWCKVLFIFKFFVKLLKNCDFEWIFTWQKGIWLSEYAINILISRLMPSHTSLHILVEGTLKFKFVKTLRNFVLVWNKWSIREYTHDNLIRLCMTRRDLGTIYRARERFCITICHQFSDIVHKEISYLYIDRRYHSISNFRENCESVPLE